MKQSNVSEANKWLEKSNAGLDLELLTVPEAKALLAEYTRAQRLAEFGIAVLARLIDEAGSLARMTGTSVGKAKETIATSKVLAEAPPLKEALKHAEISMDQATEIAKAEGSSPGVAKKLLPVAQKESFNVLREQARKAKLESEQHQGLSERQRRARSARSYSDDLGMMHIHLALEPHIGAPLVARAETEAQRLSRASNGKDREPFECLLADAYAQMLSGGGKASTTRPELVVVVSHEVVERGWTEVKTGEVCKIPGVGPISPQVARDIAHRAFLNAVISDGKDLREFKRWSKNPPIEVAIALELGDPPDFDGVACVDCGNRFRNEFDHIEPRAARGPSSRPNLAPRCWKCHKAKTARDRKAGKLKPAEP